MLAQDVGSAIKGVVRGDFYWGTGRAALDKAGRMKSTGSYYIVVPKTVIPAS
jgi:membrane-bound lytic murein transglycosylase A